MTIGERLNLASNATIDKIHKTPSTNLRQIATMVVFLSTAAKYLIASSWVPSGEWLSFIVVMAGVDVAQFGIKRKTYDPNAVNGNNA